MPKPRRGEKAAQPHDALVKWTFSQREHAIGLLNAALPPEVVGEVNWSSLRVDKDSFVDPALQSRYSDVVISARFGEEPVYFYTLIEHQRDVEPLMVFRILRYMVRIWERCLQERPRAKELPPIVPMLIHHSATGWTAATLFPDIISGKGPARKALERHIPRFEVHLIDLSEGRASNLVDRTLTALGQVVMWCLSVAGDDERMEREIDRFSAAIEEVVRAPNGLAALEVLLRYLGATHTQMRGGKVGKLLMKAAGPRAQEVVVTFLDDIERRGERKGKREGEILGERKGRERLLLDLLAARFGRLPASVKTRIGSADDATLKVWALRVLTAPTLEGVLEQEATPAAPARRAAPRKRARRA
jgi:hypothetical protein